MDVAEGSVNVHDGSVDDAEGSVNVHGGSMDDAEGAQPPHGGVPRGRRGLPLLPQREERAGEHGHLV